MVHAVWQQRQLRLVKVFCSTYSELLLWNILLQVDTLLTFSLVVVCFHAVQDWKSFIKLYARPGHWTSSDHWNIWRLENEGKWSIIDGLVGAHHVCVSRENWGQLELVSQTTLSELSSYINYINLSNFFSLDYSYWETLFIIYFP
jgi:hypothetical protein